MNASQLTITQLAATINAHAGKAEQYADKAEQHYKAAGLHLIEAKKRIAAGEYEGGFVKFLKDECKALSSSRAYELIAIANGTKTVAAIREKKAATMRRSRLALRHVVDTPVEPADSDVAQAPIAAPRSPADIRAGLDRLVEEQRQAMLAGGRRLLLGYRDVQLFGECTFAEWCDQNGFKKLPEEARWDLMFAAQFEEQIDELREQLRYPDQASTAWKTFAGVLFDARRSRESPDTEEEALVKQITAACQGQTAAQLKAILRKAAGTSKGA
jgi:hypothetical protein